MLREGVLATLLALVPAIARAEPELPSPSTPPAALPEPSAPARDPAAAFVFAPGVGFGVLAVSEPLDAALREAARSEIGTTSGATLAARFGLQVDGFSAAVTIGALMLGEEEDPSATYIERDWAIGELSYDVFPEGWLTLGPVLGAGAQVTRLCVTGQSSGPEAEGGLFNQVLTNPGSSTCVEQQQAAARVGLVGGVAAALPIDDAVVAATFDVRPAMTWALADGSYTILEQQQVPPFDGPHSPKMAFSLMIEIGFVFGFGQR